MSTKAASESMDLEVPQSPLSKFARGVVITTLILISVGAMVTSTGSGLVYRDWPLSNGSWWPPNMGLDGLFEHGHRTIGAFLGLLTVVLTTWVIFTDQRDWLRKLCFVAVGMVILQGVVGGVHVLKELPVLTGVFHAVFAQIFLCLLGFISFVQSPSWQQRTEVSHSYAATSRKLSTFALGAILFQLFLGAVGRHSGDLRFVWAHVGFAIVVTLLVVIAAMQARARFAAVPGFARISANMLLLLLAQVVLGFVALVVRRPKDPSNIEHIGLSLLVTFHVLLGATLMLTTAFLVFRSYRNLVWDAPTPAKA